MLRRRWSPRLRHRFHAFLGQIRLSVTPLSLSLNTSIHRPGLGNRWEESAVRGSDLGSELVLHPEIVIFMVRTLAAGSGIAWRGAGGVAARWAIAGGARRRALGWMTSLVNRAAISLRVSGICPMGAGLPACSVAAVMVRKASASMARVVHRYQETQRRTLMLIQPGQPLGGREVLLGGPAPPGDFDLDGEGHCAVSSSGRTPVPWYGGGDG